MKSRFTPLASLISRNGPYSVVSPRPRISATSRAAASRSRTWTMVWLSSMVIGRLRSGQRPVESGLDVQRRAREDRKLGVGLVDEQLELGAAQDQPAGAA